MATMGNTYDTNSVKYGHSRKVWREIRQVYPAGGTITNVSDFVSAGIIRAGSPVAFDPATKAITVIKDSAISGADKASDVVALGINGYTQEDVVVKDGSTVGSATVVFDGMLYDYMYSDAVIAKLKLNTLTPMIVWVH